MSERLSHLIVEIRALLPTHLLPFPLFSSTTRTVHISTLFNDDGYPLLVLFPLRLLNASTMREITYPLYPIIAFFGSILVLIPLPWHLQAWNSGTCYFIFWTFVACLNQFFNSVVWASDAVDRAPWFCEICSLFIFGSHFCQFILTYLSSFKATRITLGASVGIPAACLCISRRLFSIARVQAVLITPAEVCLYFFTTSVSV